MKQHKEFVDSLAKQLRAEYDLALQDAFINGVGFLIVNQYGELRRLQPDEVHEKSKQILDLSVNRNLDG